MSSSPENDFAQLRRLMALKRHEQPPAGYFDRLPSQITAVIKSEQQSPVEPEPAEGLVTSIMRFLEQLQARPAFAGALGLLACAALVWGVILFGNADPAPTTVPALLTVAPSAPGMMSTPIAETALTPVTAEAIPMLAATNFPTSEEPTLFDLIEGGPLRTVPVDYQPQP